VGGEFSSGPGGEFYAGLNRHPAFGKAKDKQRQIFAFATPPTIHNALFLLFALFFLPFTRLNPVSRLEFILTR